MWWLIINRPFGERRIFPPQPLCHSSFPGGAHPVERLDRYSGALLIKRIYNEIVGEVSMLYLSKDYAGTKRKTILIVNNRYSKMKKVIFFITAGIFWLSLIGCNSVLPPEKSDLDQLLCSVTEQYPQEQLTPGYGVCLFDEHGKIWSYYKGYANEQTQSLFSENTVFRVGRISEIVTAIKILQLTDEMKVDLDRSIKEYLPDLFLEAESESSLARIGDLKIRTILSHLSGSSANFFLGFRDYYPLQNIKPFLAGSSFLYPPDIKYLHAGGLIDLLGLLIESVDGAPFDAAIRGSIFDPLGMNMSSYNIETTPHLASLNYKSSPVDSYHTQIPGFREAQVPSGSMHSTINDLVSLFSSFFNQESGSDKAILSNRMQSEMFSSRTENTIRLQGLKVGFIWRLSHPDLDYLGDIAWYSGRFFNQRTVVILARDLNTGVVFVTNSWHYLDQETIFPLAKEILKKYVYAEYSKSPVTYDPPEIVELPPPLREKMGGLYSTDYGLCQIEQKETSLSISWNGLHSTLFYIGDNNFLTDDVTISRVICSSPEDLSIYLRNGMMIEAKQTEVSSYEKYWKKTFGTYRIAQLKDLKHIGLYAFTISSKGNVLIVSGDDGKEYNLVPSSEYLATITCNENALFFNRSLVSNESTDLNLGEILFVKVSPR